MAPHTQQVVSSSNWDRPYTREQAVYPAVSFLHVKLEDIANIYKLALCLCLIF